ncbi:MAG: hypothetical protein O7D34_10850 [Ignavibacteria bacterium]|nr:hypothetical protein [Ignavibacteria bacterium]
MKSQLDSKIAANRARSELDFSQLGNGYIGTPLGRKLATAKITAKSLVELSDTSKADVSHYLHLRFDKIGKAHRQRIFNALCDLGIIKRRVRKPPCCKNCGVLYPTRRSVPRWVQTKT